MGATNDRDDAHPASAPARGATDEFRDEPTVGDHTNPALEPVAEAARPRVVVIAVDFSATARFALAWAFDYALHVPCTLHTVHVIDRRWSPGDLLADAASLQREVAGAEATALAELRVLTEDARARLGNVHEHVAVGKPADELLRVTAQLGTDLLVVGSHGHDPIAHLFVGSVAERIVRGAGCPVVVVRLPKA
jgi:universal stress protein A